MNPSFFIPQQPRKLGSGFLNPLSFFITNPKIFMIFSVEHKIGM